MTTNPPMPVVVDDVANPVTVVDEKVIDFEEMMIKEGAPEQPRVDDHETKARNKKDKEVSQVLTLILQTPPPFHKD